MFKLRKISPPSEPVHHVPAPTIIAPMSEPTSVFLLWLLAVVLTAWSFGFATTNGSDLWWRLASGRWIWETGSLKFRDPWSFSRFGQPWMNPSWLSDLIFHAWSRWFGTAALVWWKWSMLVASFVLVFLALRKISGNSLTAYLATLIAVAAGAPFLDFGPQLYTVLGLAALLHLAVLPARFRWPVILGFLFWVNLHGGFLFGLLVLVVVLVIARLSGEAPRNTFPLWLGCLAAGLANPQGPEAYTFPLRYLFDPQSPYRLLGEWRPPWEAGGVHSVVYYLAVGLFVLAVVGAFLAGLHQRQRRLTFTGMVIGVFALALSCKSRHAIPLFGMAQGVLLAPVLTLALARLAGRFPIIRWTVFRQYLLPTLAVLLGAWRLSHYPLSGRAFLYLTSEDRFPVEVMNVVEANQLSGKVFAFLPWAGYVDLRTNGRLKVYIDGRADAVFDAETYRRYSRVLGLEDGWQDVLDASGAEYFLWPRRQRKHVDALRDTKKWRVLYADRIAVLLIRSDAPKPGPLLPSPESPWRQVALGWRAVDANKNADAEKHFRSALEEMPNLRVACEWLANLYARTDRLVEAEATLRDCQRPFPDPERFDELLTYFRTRANTDL